MVKKLGLARARQPKAREGSKLGKSGLDPSLSRFVQFHDFFQVSTLKKSKQKFVLTRRSKTRFVLDPDSIFRFHRIKENQVKYRQNPSRRFLRVCASLLRFLTKSRILRIVIVPEEQEKTKFASQNCKWRRRYYFRFRFVFSTPFSFLNASNRKQRPIFAKFIYQSRIRNENKTINFP